MATMEHTHLISVCVFCLLCATHIHCSEYSSRSVKSKIKLKTDNWNVYWLDKGGENPDSVGVATVFKKSRAQNPDYHINLSGDPFEKYENGENFLGDDRKERKGVKENLVKSKKRNEGTVHDESVNQSARDSIKDEGDKLSVDNESGRTVRTLLPTNRGKKVRNKRSSLTNVVNEHLFVENLFKKYRNSENRIDLNGFKKLLKHLGLNNFLSQNLDSISNSESEKVKSLKFHDILLEDNDLNGNVTGSMNIGECPTPEKLLRFSLGDSPKPGTTSKEVDVNDIATEKRKTNNPDYDETNSNFPPEKISSLNISDLHLSKVGFFKLCPVLLYHLVEPKICGGSHSDNEESQDHNFSAWLYAIISVFVVSLCGLLGALVIPIMGYAFYQHLLQFLVALAVGTLCGDALLHLLPHAMVPHHDEVHITEHDHDHHPNRDFDRHHTSTMWKGLAVLIGIVFFFFTEKFLNLGSEWRKKRQRSKKVQAHSHVQILNSNKEGDSVGEKLCKHKYSSYPYCYSDIKSNKDGHEHHRNNISEASKPGHQEERLNEANIRGSKWYNELKEAGEGQRLTQAEDVEQKEDEGAKEKSGTEKKTETENNVERNEIICDKKEGEYNVIIREHEITHHGHSHAHGHVHSPPESLSSVAWMVLLGDGLHNFTDGMAIGAAFSNNIAGGFSTAVAVFCHELPHELGDFAVLLKAGMSAKQAVFYNLISSILCFFGMCLGIFMGDDPTSTSWVFAISAGMFLYIALVDMFPELTSSHSEFETSFCQCSLQGLGLLSGVGILFIIAYYEDYLLHLFE